MAISAVSAARAFGRVDKALGEDKEAIKEFGDAFDTFLQNAFETGEIDAKITDDIKSLRIDYKQAVTEKGEVSATYVPFIEFQDKYTNRVTDITRERVRDSVSDKILITIYQERDRDRKRETTRETR